MIGHVNEWKSIHNVVKMKFVAEKELKRLLPVAVEAVDFLNNILVSATLVRMAFVVVVVVVFDVLVDMGLVVMTSTIHEIRIIAINSCSVHYVLSE